MFGLYTNFFIVPEMYVAVFIIVQLCTQFPVRESGGAGLLDCQSMILDVSVPDGIPPPPPVFSDLACLKKISLLLLVDCCDRITMLYASSYLCASYPTWSAGTGISENQHFQATDL
jgi:hypothetical protein